VEAMRSIYGSDLVLMPAPDVEMAVDTPETGEVAFTLITNKKYKRKSKASFLSFMFFSKNNTSLISQASY